MPKKNACRTRGTASVFRGAKRHGFLGGRLLFARVRCRDFVILDFIFEGRAILAFRFSGLLEGGVDFLLRFLGVRFDPFVVIFLCQEFVDCFAVFVANLLLLFPIDVANVAAEFSNLRFKVSVDVVITNVLVLPLFL